MSYYQGDFYRGDFYRGDPGFFGALLNIGKMAAGFIPGVGPAVQAGLGAATALTTKAVRTAAVPAGTSMMRQAGTSLARRTVAAVKGHPVLSAAGAAGVIGGTTVLGTKRGRRMIGLGPHMRRRRMNVCNPHALRRAIRRTHGFAKLAMRTIHIVHPKKKGRFGGFRRRRTRARS